MHSTLTSDSRLPSSAWTLTSPSAPSVTSSQTTRGPPVGGNAPAPPSETVTLISGQTTSLTRTYTPAGQILVMLSPNTAQWRVDAGPWQASNTYTGYIAAGSHIIDYSSLPNMLTPPSETVSVVAGQTLTISKAYAVESGLIINLSPAIGQWRVDGGAWRDSAERVGQLTGGSHAVEYSAAAGYTAPTSESVFLSTGSDKTLSRSYLLPASVTVNVMPAEGQWRLNNGPWQASGATLTGLRPGKRTTDTSSENNDFHFESHPSKANSRKASIKTHHILGL